MPKGFEVLAGVARAAASSHQPEVALRRGLMAMLEGYGLPCGEVYVPVGEGLRLEALEGCQGRCPLARPLAALAETAARERRIRRTAGLVAVPIAFGGRVRAVYAFADADPEHPIGEAFLRTLAGVVALWLEHAELYQRLRQREAERGRLLKKLLVVQEEERRRVGQELHDELGARLTAALLALRLAERDPGQLEGAREQIKAAMQTVRQLSRALRPAALDELGLKGAIAALLAGSGVAHTLALRVPRLDPVVELVAYRVLQEAITNALRHARAGRIEVRLEKRGDRLFGEVRDDGSGFDPAATPEGVGILGMRERVEQLGGRFVLESRPGEGTRVAFELPLEAS